jgi:hypothetical protein
MYMTAHEMLKIPLKAAETVVSVTSHRDYIIVVTDRGTIYKIIPAQGD